jgi:hypothetical protein
MPRLRVNLVTFALTACVVAIAGCGGSDGPQQSNETVANARSTIERLPYPITLRSPPRESSGLLATIGDHGSDQRFYVFVHGHEDLPRGAVARALNVKSFEHVVGGELTENYAVLYSERLTRRSENIVFEVEEALCEQALEEPCGI